MKNNLLLTSLYSFILLFNTQAKAQVEAKGVGGFSFDREAIIDIGDGAGYSFYSAVWPLAPQYPGPGSFQIGLPGTWLKPFFPDNEPENFYNTIEGGLGWWGDTRFGTTTPKFIMGGVAYNFSQWANGTGAGSSDLLDDERRDWSVPYGKYGVAQLSPRLLWPPDGLNMAQGSNGEFLGYGYHPLPLTDPMAQTYGTNFSTGNQCWTLFLNTINFKGPVAFFVPTFWTETALNNPSVEGLFIDSNATDKNPSFAMEYTTSPALIGTDAASDTFARMLPLVFPKTSAGRSDIIRDIKVYTKAAKWDAIQSWFNGGEVAPTAFETSGSTNLLFDLANTTLSGNIVTPDEAFGAKINYNFGQRKMNPERTLVYFEWDTNVVQDANNRFTLPEYYKLNTEARVWDHVSASAVPAETGLLTNEPVINPRSEISYLTPMEPDCHLQDPNSPWRSPGPVAGPFTADLGDGSTITYYWYRFIDQPAITYANLPESIRQNLQARIELIHANWSHTDEYLPAPTGGTLVGLDPGLIVTPPAGLEVGYVPIVTRQEKTITSVSSISTTNNVLIYPNPTKGQINVSSTEDFISEIKLFNTQGILIDSWTGLQKDWVLRIENKANGIYFLEITSQNKTTFVQRIVKVE